MALGADTMTFKVLGPISQIPGKGWVALLWEGKSTIQAVLSSDFDPGMTEPQKLQSADWRVASLLALRGEQHDETWSFGGYSVLVRNKDIKTLTPDQLCLEVKYAVMHHDKHFNQLQRSIDAFENLERVEPARRERIPDPVRLFVWQRDSGKCVKCGSTEKLEFDHIIPVVKGGSNTERNIQLLCEACNRSKGANI